MLCKHEIAEAKLVKLHGLARSGNFLKWDEVMMKQTDWNEQILFMSESEQTFLMNAQGLTLPSASNLHRWGLKREASCYLCGKLHATLNHSLSGCIVALNQHRYTWRHTNVLESVVQI